MVSSKMFPVSVAVLCLASLASCQSWKPVQERPNSVTPARDTGSVEEEGRWWLPVTQLRGLRSLYDECMSREEDSGMACLKGKALVYLDRVMSKQSITLGEGVSLDRSGVASGEKMVQSEEQLNANLPRDLNQREARLDEMLLDHVAVFLQTHTLKLDLSGRALQETVSEARKKGKKAAPYLLFAMLAAGKLILAYSLKTIALIAGKALIVAKIALVLASVIGLKKLFSHEPEHHSSHHEVSERNSVVYAREPYHSSSSYGRSFAGHQQQLAAAHKLAYSMQIPRPQ